LSIAPQRKVWLRFQNSLTTRANTQSWKLAISAGLCEAGHSVNAVNPGALRLIDRIPNQLGGTVDDFASMVPMGRIRQKKSLNRCFLCSDTTTYITGQPLVIDGGFTVSCSRPASWLSVNTNSKVASITGTNKISA